MKTKPRVAVRMRALGSMLILVALVFALSWGASNVRAGSVTYTYDELGRLKAITYSNGSSTAFNLDAAGNRKSVVTLLDTTPPTVPSSLTASAVSQTQVNLTWGASTDAGIGMGGYYVLRKTGAGSYSTIATVNASTTSYSDTTVAGFTAYTYEIEAFDLASPPNVSAASVSANATTPDQAAPSTPTLSATAASQTQINLSWSASSDTGGSGLGGYKVFRNGATTPLTTLAPTTTTYSDTGLAGFTAYTYTVQAFDNATPTNNVSSLSNVASATTPDQTAPSAPSALSATAISSTQVNLSWTSSTDTGGSGLRNYQITRNSAVLTTTTATTFSDTTVGGGTTYNYTVNASDNAGNFSAASNLATATTPTGAPTAPGQPSPNGVIVTATPWTESWGASTGAVSYYTVHSFNGSTTVNTNVTAPATSASLAGTNGVTYTITVQACNSSNVCSANSPSATVTYCKAGKCP